MSPSVTSWALLLVLLASVVHGDRLTKESRSLPDSNSSCWDDDATCGLRAETGECQINADLMFHVCPFSCGFCTNETQHAIQTAIRDGQSSEPDSQDETNNLLHKDVAMTHGIQNASEGKRERSISGEERGVKGEMEEAAPLINRGTRTDGEYHMRVKRGMKGGKRKGGGGRRRGGSYGMMSPSRSSGKKFILVKKSGGSSRGGGGKKGGGSYMRMPMIRRGGGGGGKGKGKKGGKGGGGRGFMMQRTYMPTGGYGRSQGHMTSSYGRPMSYGMVQSVARPQSYGMMQSYGMTQGYGRSQSYGMTRSYGSSRGSRGGKKHG